MMSASRGSGGSFDGAKRYNAHINNCQHFVLTLFFYLLREDRENVLVPEAVEDPWMEWNLMLGAQQWTTMWRTRWFVDGFKALFSVTKKLGSRPTPSEPASTGSYDENASLDRATPPIGDGKIGYDSRGDAKLTFHHQ